MTETKIVENPAEFAVLGPTWNNLLSRSCHNSPYLTHEWLYSWWEAFAQPCDRLHVLLFYEKSADGDNLIGILPTYIKTLIRFPRLRIMRFLGSQHVGSDFLGLIVATGKRSELHQALLGHLKEPWAFELIEWINIAEDSRLIEALQSSGLSRGITLQCNVSGLCPYIKLPTSFNIYRSTLGRRARRTFRDLQKLRDQGMTLEIITSRTDLRAAIADFIHMHNMVRSQKGDLGCFATPARLRFHKSVFERFFDKGWLKLMFLQISGERVAGACRFDYAQRIYDYSTGYNLNWARMRVGFFLHLLAIEEAIKHGKLTYENGRGAEEYKYTLGANAERKLMHLSLSDGFVTSKVYRKTKALTARIKTAERTVAPEWAHQFLKRARMRLFALTSLRPNGTSDLMTG